MYSNLFPTGSANWTLIYLHRKLSYMDTDLHYHRLSYLNIDLFTRFVNTQVDLYTVRRMPEVLSANFSTMFSYLPTFQPWREKFKYNTTSWTTSFIFQVSPFHIFCLTGLQPCILADKTYHEATWNSPSKRYKFCRMIYRLRTISQL